MSDDPQFRREILLPDLGIGDAPVVLSVWLVKIGEYVTAGDPVVEVMTGPATIDLPAPSDGILCEKLVAEGQSLSIGQRLAVIECD